MVKTEKVFSGVRDQLKFSHLFIRRFCIIFGIHIITLLDAEDYQASEKNLNFVM